MGKLIHTIERVNSILRKNKVSSLDDLAEKAGLSSNYLYKLQRRGSLKLELLDNMKDGRKRGVPLDTYGPIAENLGIVEMLSYWGFTAEQIGDEIGVTKEAVWEYLRNHPKLYSEWRTARKLHNYIGVVNEDFGIFAMMSYMGLPHVVIAEEFGISTATVYYHQKRKGLYEAWRRERWGN